MQQNEIEPSKEETFLVNKFKEFYSKNKIEFPSAIEKREFGIGSFGKKIANRHLSFSSLENLNKFLTQKTPLYISYSNAYYEFPAKTPMQAKNFLESDLVYEFDADDIPTKCKEEHDFWECPSCKAKGAGAISNCPKCGAGVSVEQWFCEKCLQKTKEETLRLIDVLQNDFNFPDISINFSGNAGYHIHLENETLRKLPQIARIQLLDYLTLHNVDLELLGFSVREKEKILSCPEFANAKGLSKRLLQKLISFLEQADASKIAAYGGTDKRKVASLLKDKDRLLEKLKEGILMPLPSTQQSTSKKFWFSLIDFVKDSSEIALSVDRQTSVDLHKIVRVPNTLHGGTGLQSKNVSLNELPDFDPFNDCVSFSDSPVKVFIHSSPKFSLLKQSFGPFKDSEEELPEFAAVYLIAKKKAVLKE